MAERSGQSKDLSGSSVGRFRIGQRLGSGGMGEVYLAEDMQLRRTVAIKRMSLRFGEDQRYRQRFLREAQMASRLNDPRIAAVYDVFEREGEIFLVMERVEGKTLRECFHDPISLEDFLPIAQQVAEALSVAHGAGVLHRDIKPDNIMVTPSGGIKILDFGLARGVATDEETVAFETEPGTVSGTPGYIAPEVLVGNEADARSDIFSLGVVFYESLTAHHPFRAKTNIATSSRVLHEIPPAPSSVNSAVPAEVDRIVNRMLAKDPAERYQSARDICSDLKWFVRSGTQQGITAAPVRKAAASRRFGRRHPALVALAAAAVLLASLAAIPRVRHTVAGLLRASPATIPAGNQQKQLAVLPFTVLGGTSSQQAFAAGLTDIVTARLSQLSGTHNLSVVPSSLVFADKVSSPQQARQHYGVSLVLTGSLQQAANRIRVTYALVDTRTQRQLSADTKTVSAANPFAVEDDVATGVLDMLQVQLEPAERKTFEAKGTDKPGAYAYYLQGMGYMENYYEVENITSAISVFERALAIDPNYARAEAGLGMAYWQRYVLTSDAGWTTPSREACDRAVALEPNLAPAHVCLGIVANGTGKYQDAVAQFQKALDEQPTDDDAYRGLANAYEKLGRTAEAEQTFQKAIRLRPQYWGGYNWLGVFYERLGRYAEAAQMFQQVVALAPDSFTAYSNLGAVYVLSGDFEKAIKPLEKSIAIRPTGSAYTNLGVAQFYLRHYDEAATNFEKAAGLQPNDYTIWRNVGDGYYWARGKRAQADAAYQKAIGLAEDALRVNPKSGDAYEILALCRAMTGAGQQAIAAIARALALSPDNPDVTYAAAIVYTQAGQREQGLEWLKKALKAGYSPAMAQNEPAFDALRGMKNFPGSLGH